MSNYFNDDDEICCLEEQLDEFLKDANKIIGYEIGSIEETIKKLFSLNIPKSIQLANDILDTQHEINNLLESRNIKIRDDDPFLYLKNDDDEI